MKSIKNIIEILSLLKIFSFNFLSNYFIHIKVKLIYLIYRFIMINKLIITSIVILNIIIFIILIFH
jgi:hypothetical protein